MKIFELLCETTIPPNKFWLVFDIPLYDEISQNDVINSLKNQKLDGVKGISGSKRIVIEFFGVARNALLVMDSDSFLKINPSVKKIEYDNPDNLLSNNMDNLYRIFSKNSDQEHDRIGVWQNIGDYITKWCNISGYSDMAKELLHNPFGEKIGFYYNQNYKPINNLNDLVDMFLEGIENNKRFDSYRKKILLKFFTPKVAKDALYGALKTIGKIYDSEDEWIVNSSHLNIPENSSLIIGINMKIKRMWDEWKNNKLDKPTFLVNKKYILEFDKFINNVDKLKQIYKINFIDMDKFSTIRLRRI